MMFDGGYEDMMNYRVRDDEVEITVKAKSHKDAAQRVLRCQVCRVSGSRLGSGYFQAGKPGKLRGEPVFVQVDFTQPVN